MKDEDLTHESKSSSELIDLKKEIKDFVFTRRLKTNCGESIDL